MAKQNGLTAVHKRRIRKLVDALRSGKYKQCKRQLRDGDSFCCLGVACDLYSKAKHEPWEDRHGIPSFAGEIETLPVKVVEYYGFDRVEHGPLDSPDNPSLIMKTKSSDALNAAALNDDYNYSFKRIATLFEKRFLKD